MSPNVSLRGPQHRLSAEFVRDLVLLEQHTGKVGRQLCNPYQPKGLWESATSGDYGDKRDHGDSSTGKRDVYVYKINGTTSFHKDLLMPQQGISVK
ncbi:MAG: hypothetical protein QM764_16145 [Chitinophagaceae bacterium]